MFSPNFIADWAGRMVNGVVEGLLLALIAWAVLRVLGRQNSQTRFAIWFATLLGIAALPLVRFGSISSVNGKPAHFAFPASWSLVVAGLWAFFAMIFLVRVAVGLYELRKIRRESRRIDSTLNVLQKFDTSRKVELLVSPSLRVPTAIGFFRPAVIFPEWALNELSAEERNAILLHEIAHLRRWDDWTNLAQQVLKAIFFFHPAVWWIESRLTLEREMACDQLVLAETKNPQAYAKCLVSMAEKGFLRRGLSLAQAMVGRVKQISLRITEILNGRLPNSRRVYKPAVAMLAVFVFVSAGEFSRMPELVAFRDAAVNSASSSVESYPTHVTPTLASYKVVKQKSPSLIKHQKTISMPVARRIEPTLARLDVNTIAPKSLGLQPVFVVMETQQVGPSGELYWSFQIYQLTVFHSATPQAQKENQGKQI